MTKRHCLTSSLLCIAIFFASSAPAKDLQILIKASLGDPSISIHIENDSGKMVKYDPVKDVDDIEKVLKSEKHYLETFILRGEKVERAVFKRKIDAKPQKP